MNIPNKTSKLSIKKHKTKQNSEKPDDLSIPKYKIKNIKENEKIGWMIKIYCKEKVYYRILSSYEQCVEPLNDQYYISILIKNYKNFGFRFHATNPSCYHIPNKKKGKFIIHLFSR